MILKCKKLEGWSYRPIQDIMNVKHYLESQGCKFDDAFVETVQETELYAIKPENVWLHTPKSQSLVSINYQAPSGEWYGLITSDTVFLVNEDGQTIEKIN